MRTLYSCKALPLLLVGVGRQTGARCLQRVVGVCSAVPSSSIRCNYDVNEWCRDAGSPHARVATAAAGALSAAAATCGPTLEPHLDRFLAALFGAAVSPRPEVATAACQALAGEQAKSSSPVEQAWQQAVAMLNIAVATAGMELASAAMLWARCAGLS